MSEILHYILVPMHHLDSSLASQSRVTMEAWTAAINPVRDAIPFLIDPSFAAFVAASVRAVRSPGSNLSSLRQ